MYGKMLVNKNKKILIYGNGAMAKVLYSYCRSSFDVCGFTVDDHCIKEQFFYGLPLIPFSKVHEKFSPKKYSMISSIGFIEMNELRERKYLEAKEKGYNFISFIDSSIRIHNDVEIQDNCIILDCVSIHPGVKIGSGTFISSNVNIGHDCKIEPYNWINSGVSLAGGCHVGKGCFFGVNSALANKVELGERNFIGAGTVINKSTKNDEVYISEPGQLFKLKSKQFLKFANVI
jgi:sugar O-acyltransferase (sialic acid O-acetyltransferase NeuD family)